MKPMSAEKAENILRAREHYHSRREGRPKQFWDKVTQSWRKQ